MCKFPDLGSPERVKMKEDLKKNSSKCAYVIIELVSYQPSVHARRLQYSVVYVLISVSVTSTMKPVVMTSNDTLQSLFPERWQDL